MNPIPPIAPPPDPAQGERDEPTLREILALVLGELVQIRELLEDVRAAAIEEPEPIVDERTRDVAAEIRERFASYRGALVDSPRER